MKNLFATTALVISMAGGSLAFAMSDDMPPPPPHHEGGKTCMMKNKQELLAKLPEEKEMLFHKTMRQVREGKMDMKEKMKTLREEQMKVLTAETFDEAAFMAKSKEAQALYDSSRVKKTAAIAELAKQYSQEERKVLAELMPGKKGCKGNWGSKDRGNHHDKDGKN